MMDLVDHAIVSFREANAKPGWHCIVKFPHSPCAGEDFVPVFEAWQSQVHGHGLHSGCGMSSYAPTAEVLLHVELPQMRLNPSLSLSVKFKHRG